MQSTKNQIFIFIIVSTCAAAIAQVAEQLKPGIYVEKIGSMWRVEEKAEIYYEIDISSSVKNSEKLEKIQSIITTTCNKSFLPNTHRNCDMTQKWMNVRMDDIKTKLESFKPRRSKRSPLDIVGSGLRFCFGTMDQEDRIRVDRKMTEVDERLKTAEENMMKVGTLMQHTVEAFSMEIKTCLSNNTIFDTINENFKKLERMENLLEQQVRQDQFITEMTFAFEFLSSKQLKFLENVHETLDDLANGIFSTKLLTLENIWNDMNSIKIPDVNRMIPFTEKMKTEDFKKLCKFGVFNSPKGYAIIFVIPIISTEKSLIHHVISIPKILNDIAKCKKVSNSWIITDKSLMKSSETDARTMNELCEIIDNQFYCDDTFTWTKKETCELAAINGNEVQIEADCETIAFKMNSTIFIKTQSNNKLIVLCDKPKKAKFVGKTATNLQLFTSTMVFINDSGRLFIDDFEINFPKREHFRLLEKTIEYKPIEIDIPEFNTTKASDLELIPIIQDRIISPEKINELAIEWKDFVKNLQEKETHKTLKMWIVSFTAALATLIGIGVTGLLFKKWYNRWKLAIDEQANLDQEMDEISNGCNCDAIEGSNSN